MESRKSSPFLNRTTRDCYHEITKMPSGFMRRNIYATQCLTVENNASHAIVTKACAEALDKLQSAIKVVPAFILGGINGGLSTFDEIED
jgi:hypothetical protein